MLRFAALLLVVPLAACAGAEAGPSEPEAAEGEAPMGTVIVTVKELDPVARVVTVSDSVGHTRTFRVDARAGALDEIKPGDRVRMDYYEALALSLVKPAENGGERDVVVEAAPPASLPAGAADRSVTTEAVVEAIDPENSLLTLRLEDGAYARMKVRDPERLQALQVGDRLRLTYAEALAVVLVPAESAEAR